MKHLNKKILEAIQKGINLAVDDFDSLDTIEVQKKARIKDDIHAKDILFMRENFVDLGLPSGTLWAKYDIGVDTKNLYVRKSWKGKTFDPTEKVVDHATELLGNKWKTPTVDQYQELMNYTDYAIDTICINSTAISKNMDNTETIRTLVLTSKINGEKIFFPSISSYGFAYGGYLTSTFNEEEYMYYKFYYEENYQEHIGYKVIRKIYTGQKLAKLRPIYGN